MNINATLLIQAINFFITYWLLRSFLFKPTIGVIDTELAHKASMLELINQLKDKRKSQEKEHARLWEICREYCKAHSPDSAYQVCVITNQPEAPTETSIFPEEQEIIADIYKTLEGKIKNVR